MYGPQNRTPIFGNSTGYIFLDSIYNMIYSFYMLFMTSDLPSRYQTGAGSVRLWVALVPGGEVWSALGFRLILPDPKPGRRGCPTDGWDTVDDVNAE